MFFKDGGREVVVRNGAKVLGKKVIFLRLTAGDGAIVADVNGQRLKAAREEETVFEAPGGLSTFVATGNGDKVEIRIHRISIEGGKAFMRTRGFVATPEELDGHERDRRYAGSARAALKAAREVVEAGEPARQLELVEAALARKRQVMADAEAELVPLRQLITNLEGRRETLRAQVEASQTQQLEAEARALETRLAEVRVALGQSGQEVAVPSEGPQILFAVKTEAPDNGAA